MKLKNKYLIILLPFFLGACTPFEIVSDQYWAKALPGVFEKSVKNITKGFGKGYGFNTKVVDLVSGNSEKLEFLSYRRGGLYLFSPLLSDAGQEKAKEVTSAFFFCFTRSNVESSPRDNLILIHGYSAISPINMEETIENLVFIIFERGDKHVYKDIYLH